MLLKERGYIYRRIFFASTAVHGFRTGGLTPGRQRWLNQKARDILVPTGWEIFDAYNITLGRPDGTNDGVHYRGGVSVTLTDLFLNSLIHSNTTDESTSSAHPKDHQIKLDTVQRSSDTGASITKSGEIDYKKLYEASLRELDELEKKREKAQL